MDRGRRPEPAFAGEDAHGHEHGHQLDEPEQKMSQGSRSTRAVQDVAGQKCDEMNPGDGHQGPRPAATALHDRPIEFLAQSRLPVRARLSPADGRNVRACGWSIIPVLLSSWCLRAYLRRSRL